MAVAVAAREASSTHHLPVDDHDVSALDLLVQLDDGLLDTLAEAILFDKDFLLLPKPVDAPSRLRLLPWVGARLHQKDAVGGCQGDADGGGRVSDDEDAGTAVALVRLEVFDQRVALGCAGEVFDGLAAAAVAEAEELERSRCRWLTGRRVLVELKDLERLLSLWGREQAAVAHLGRDQSDEALLHGVVAREDDGSHRRLLGAQRVQVGHQSLELGQRRLRPPADRRWRFLEAILDALLHPRRNLRLERNLLVRAQEGSGRSGQRGEFAGLCEAWRREALFELLLKLLPLLRPICRDIVLFGIGQPLLAQDDGPLDALKVTVRPEDDGGIVQVRARIELLLRLQREAGLAAVVQVVEQLLIRRHVEPRGAAQGLRQRQRHLAADTLTFCVPDNDGSQPLDDCLVLHLVARRSLRNDPFPLALRPRKGRQPWVRRRDPIVASDADSHLSDARPAREVPDEVGLAHELVEVCREGRAGHQPLAPRLVVLEVVELGGGRRARSSQQVRLPGVARGHAGGGARELLASAMLLAREQPRKGAERSS